MRMPSQKQPLGFDEIMRRALLVKPDKAKKKSRPKKAEKPKKTTVGVAHHASRLRVAPKPFLTSVNGIAGIQRSSEFR